MRRIAAVATWALAMPAAVAALILVAGCGEKAKEPYNDAPRSETVNKDAADIIAMPDGFSNLATKCDHGNRIYVVFHNDSAYGSVDVVPNDPSCQ